MRGSCHGPVLGALLACSWRDWGIPWKFLVCIVIPQAMWKFFIVQSSGLSFNADTRQLSFEMPKILWKFSEILKNIWNGRCVAVAYRTIINVECFVCSGLLLLCLSTEQAFISNKLKFVNIHIISHVVDDFHLLPIMLKYIYNVRQFIVYFQLFLCNKFLKHKFMYWCSLVAGGFRSVTGRMRLEIIEC